MLVKERNDLIAVEINPGFGAEGVMTTRDSSLAMFDLKAAEFAHYIPREIDRKAQIVKRVNITLRARREF